MLLLHFCKNKSFNFILAALTSRTLLIKIWLYHIPENPSEHNNFFTYSIHLLLILVSFDKEYIMLHIIDESL